MGERSGQSDTWPIRRFFYGAGGLGYFMGVTDWRFY